MNSRKTGPVPVQQSLWIGKEDPVRDVWTGVLKSALQKHVRRGETDLALPVAAELLKRAKTEFFQRWPVIVAEDVLPGVALLPQLRDNPLGVVRATCRLPKNKETWGLYIAMKADPMQASLLPGFDRPLEASLDGDDPLLAARIAWWLWDVGDRAHVADVLVQRAKPAWCDGQRELLARVAKSYDMCQTMFMLAGAVMIAMGQVGDVSVRVRPVTPSDVEPLASRTVAWYACDTHTAPGSMASRALASRYLPSDVSVAQFKETWFWLESAKLGEPIADHRYYSVDASLMRDGVDPDRARALWARYRPDVQRLVVWAGTKFNIHVVVGVERE